MKITKKQLKTIVAEGMAFDFNRFGFMGTGFGSPNSYNPYKTQLTEEKDEEELVDDAWAGGDNLVNPVDYAEVYVGEEAVKHPEILSMTESKLRQMIRTMLIRGSRK